MTLDKWMRVRRLTNEAMAGLLMDVREEEDPVVSGIMVSRWRRGVVGPSVEYVAAIFAATKGEVSPVDLARTHREAKKVRAP
jgi:DNA-binding transcriptional regulator YdaS (Cro superfamily)